MFKSLLSRNGYQKPAIHSEGEIYKILNILDKVFEIRYGYYEDYERENPFIDPIPIYPDFKEVPEYTNEGIPFVTKMQDICKHYKGRHTAEADCGECDHYRHCDELIGICLCINNKKLSKLEDIGIEQEEQK